MHLNILAEILVSKQHVCQICQDPPIYSNMFEHE